MVEKYAPNRRWHIDSIIKVLTLAGNYVEEESIAVVIHLISATKNLQTYSVCKVFFSLREHMNQQGLTKLTLWCLGEFGELLISGQARGPDDAPIQVTEKEVVGLINKLLAMPNIDENIQEYGLNCLIKLYPKY